MTRALPSGVRRKARVLADRMRRLERRIADREDASNNTLDWWKAEAAALSFALDVINSDFGAACEVLRRRREEAGTL